MDCCRAGALGREVEGKMKDRQFYTETSSLDQTTITRVP